MNRRQLIKAGINTAAIASVIRPDRLMAQQAPATAAASGETIYVNPGTGADGNSGAKNSPLRTLGEAGRRVSQSNGTGPMTIMLSAGIYAVGEAMLLKPQKRTFSATDRLTIRAEFLPDDPGWTADGMPTLIPTMPFPNPPTWNGRPDGGGGAVDEILVETSHVSILGLKFLGLPVLEGPKLGVTRRLYGINRNNRELDDLEIGHCMFLGDYVTLPIHVAIIANGDGINIHHTIFRENKITAVYWQAGSKGHAMRNCVITGCYGSGIWTASIQGDFKFENNIMDDCRYAWTYQGAAAAPPFLYNPDGTPSTMASRGGAAADLAAEGRGGPAGAQVAGGRGVAGGPAAGAPAAGGAAAAGGAPAAGGRGGGRGPIAPADRIHYKLVNSYFGKNKALAGSGTGASLGYIEIEPNFMDMVGTKVTNQPVAIEMDQAKRNYLHPVAGSEAAKIGAGIFAKS